MKKSRIKWFICFFVLFLMIWRFSPKTFLYLDRSDLGRSTRMVVQTITQANNLTLHRAHKCAADFNPRDNTFAIIYPFPNRPGRREIIEEMKILPEGIEITKCTFKPVLIKDREDPDDNQIVLRLKFNRDGNCCIGDSAIHLGNERGQVRKVLITNPGGKIKVYRK